MTRNGPLPILLVLRVPEKIAPSMDGFHEDVVQRLPGTEVAVLVKQMYQNGSLANGKTKTCVTPSC